ncbi:gamma-glutamylcyclotransferase [Pseudomonas sp. CAN2814]|uniref:gamma-glutamylcyclotransferase family protein n=1 Tax=Pseudomonas sp. CAN1 TaxID=3046726 RepID=UPI0026494CA5|nr:gamma-glutamylcyclotransferase [Pseudomonas sp. CAN1]MDN6859214.1 gamma-glutamylcyclotransferase [Pseudomonas sp. CAN1]
MTDRLFVYGTLGPGRPNEHVLARIGGTWLEAQLKGELIQAGWGAGMGFPGLVIDADGEIIRGHVFQSEHLAEHWDALDRFEGAEYQRVLTAVTLVDGQQVQAYVYALR